MRIVIIGCGRVGAGLAARLEGAAHSVAAVDTNPAALDRLGPRFRGRRIVGVGFDRDVLIGAGIERADALAAVTGSDEANAVVARAAARHFEVPRVVARLYDPRQARLYRHLGIQVVHPIEWGIGRFVELLTLSDLADAGSLGNGQVALLDAELPPLLNGRPVEELAILGEVTVVAISRSGRTFLPEPGAVLAAGDIVHLAVESRSRGRLRSILGV